MYNLLPAQTDSTPFVLADGTVVKSKNYGKFRWCAISQDLLEKNGGNLNFGDVIYVNTPNPKFTGTYRVKDVMHKRWTNKIDLLISPRTKPHSYKNVEIISYE